MLWFNEIVKTFKNSQKLSNPQILKLSNPQTPENSQTLKNSQKLSQTLSNSLKHSQKLSNTLKHSQKLSKTTKREKLAKICLKCPKHA